MPRGIFLLFYLFLFLEFFCGFFFYPLPEIIDYFIGEFSVAIFLMCVFFFFLFFPRSFFLFFCCPQKKTPLHNKQNKKQNCNRWKNKTQKRFDRFAFIGRRRRRSRSASSRAPAPSFAAIGRPGQLGTGQSNLWMIFSFFFLFFFFTF